MSHPTSDELSAFYDGELDSARLDQISAHVAACPDCCSTLETFARMKEAASTVEALDELTAQRFISENRSRRQQFLSKAPSSMGLHITNQFLKLGVTLMIAASLVVTVWAVMGGPFRSAFTSGSTDVGHSTMGQNQAALSGGIY